MEYNFNETEKKWQKFWKENKTYKVSIDRNKPKYYVLDMFPYPSGAGLHVGHPLGYIASDIYARYKRLKGFNVLHPMGYDAFGLPAEQYALQTGQHPAVTTEQNIKRYREQLDKIGFCFDWDREVRTSDPKYYKWTQWIFIQLFNSWYDKSTDKALPIDTLIAEFEKSGNRTVRAAGKETGYFSAAEWKGMDEEAQQKTLLNYRLAYLSESMVNWCPALGTVLANDEVKDGVSERGGYPVVQKKMKQWSLRITAYAERLLQGLKKLDWSESLKEMQRNWIGRSEGASIRFKVNGHEDTIEVFTTRPDTIFGVTFMVLAPEHELVNKITTAEYQEEVEQYIEAAQNKSERERMTEVKKISGAFTGGFAEHPFTGEKLPVWIADYVLAGYGTGAVMAVPSGDQRDWNFARHYGLPIVPVIEGSNVEEGAEDSKDGILMNSEFLNGMRVPDAIKKAIKAIEEKGIGLGTINYKLHDAVFSRQRYWGEPFPVYYKNEIPYVLNEDQLPLKLPEVDQYKPTETGEPPLARAKNWKWPLSGSPRGGEKKTLWKTAADSTTAKNQVLPHGEDSGGAYPLETNTMPGWAGSSWYYLRYMDPYNEKNFVSKEAVDYWKNVDLYIGGAEHATGHLLYFRFWTKFLYDLGYIPFDEPAKKLINQGMIQGVSSFVYRIKETNKFVSKNLKHQYDTVPVYVDISFVKGNELDLEGFKSWNPEYKNAEFILEDGKYICGQEVEKMSKSKYNVVSPDALIEQYGADTLRMYEMFLGPIEDHKPWDTHGIEGVFRFLKKFWRLFHDENNQFNVSDEQPDKKELKVLHRTIKKVQEDIERYSFNTVVSEFMICTNELSELKCKKRTVLEPLVIILSPYAPHISEELWNLLGHDSSVVVAAYPSYDSAFLVEESVEYPVSFNGKTRFKIELPTNLSKEDVEKEVLAHEQAQKWLEGKPPKKVIVVPKRIVNVVV